jgi:hypothetical protein
MPDDFKKATLFSGGLTGRGQIMLGMKRMTLWDR